MSKYDTNYATDYDTKDDPSPTYSEKVNSNRVSFNSCDNNSRILRVMNEEFEPLFPNMYQTNNVAEDSNSSIHKTHNAFINGYKGCIREAYNAFVNCIGYTFNALNAFINCINTQRELAIFVLVFITTISLLSFGIAHLHGTLRDEGFQVPDNVTKIPPDNVTKVPDNVTKVPDNVTKVPDNVTKVSDNVTKVPDDVTKVPRTFQLRWRSIFGDDYAMVIESYDTDYKGLSGFSEYDDTNAEANITDNQIKYPIRALILDRNYNKGEYSVEEYFYEPNQEDYYKKITTANVEFKGNWPAEFLITFTSNGSYRDPASLEICDYKLLYSKYLTGQVLRRCTKAFETRFSVQAYVYGSVNDGLKFIESEGGNTWYAFTKEPSWRINYSKRDVFVHEYAPFPPLIPALYSVYYDFLSRKLLS